MHVGIIQIIIRSILQWHISEERTCESTGNNVFVFTWNSRERCRWCLKCSLFGLVRFLFAIIRWGGSWKYTHLQMIHLETGLKQWCLDLNTNRLGPVRVEKFPGADPWPFYLKVQGRSSVVFLIKSQPGAIVWSAQEGPDHPPISQWITSCLHASMMDFST